MSNVINNRGTFFSADVRVGSGQGVTTEYVQNLSNKIDGMTNSISAMNGNRPSQSLFEAITKLAGVKRKISEVIESHNVLEAAENNSGIKPR